MSTPTPTKRDAIDAAMSVADDVAHGRLDPSALQQQAVAELRDLFGSVVGEGDPLWSLHADVARQAVGLGALSPEELREWAAVLDRQRGNETSEVPAPHEDLPAPVNAASSEASPSKSASDDDADQSGATLAAALTLLAENASAAETSESTGDQPKPKTAGDGYDPLAGWNPGGSRR